MVIQKEKANQRLTFVILLSLCINIIIAIVCFGFKIEVFSTEIIPFSAAKMAASFTDLLTILHCSLR